MILYILIKVRIEKDGDKRMEDEDGRVGVRDGMEE